VVLRHAGRQRGAPRHATVPDIPSDFPPGHGANYCVLFDEVPQARHFTPACPGECLCSRLNRFTEVYWALLEFQGGLVGYAMNDITRLGRWLEGLATTWVRRHRGCLIYQASLEPGA